MDEFAAVRVGLDEHFNKARYLMEHDQKGACPKGMGAAAEIYQPNSRHSGQTC